MNENYAVFLYVLETFKFCCVGMCLLIKKEDEEQWTQNFVHPLEYEREKYRIINQYYSGGNISV